MIYLSGGVAPAIWEEPRPDFGLMLNPGTGNRAGLRAGVAWAADNGCYAKGDAFDPDEWLAWLRSLAPYRATCLFAVCPDVVGDAVATLERSNRGLDRIHELGFRAAFVTQDGCRDDLVPWDDLDALFVGGSTAWKLSEQSYALLAEARRRGKHTHMGRVNSLKRLRACHASHVDSADGTFVAFGPRRRYPEAAGWLDALRAQPALFTP
jgi:hypothetical protein